MSFNDTIIKIKIGTQIFTIRGYSRAGLCTSILIDEFNVVFDMGYQHFKSHSYDNKLISHGHCDHIGALHTDHCTRKLLNNNKNKLYIMPDQCITPYKMIISCFSILNKGIEKYDIKPINNLFLTDIISAENCIDNYYNLIGSANKKSEYFVKTILMDHNISNYGYIIYRKSHKLKEEYAILDKKDLIKLKNNLLQYIPTNINKKDYIISILTYEQYTPLVGYTGDTSINGVITNTELLNVPLLIMECTGFSISDKKIIECNKHIHFDDIVKNNNLFNNNKILLFHFSQQYNTLDDIKEYITNIPTNLNEKLLYFF